MLAPAVLGQFPGTINNLIGALKKLGFADVVEVAIGADITTRKEAAEFIEKMENGEKMMTTSCCPAYYKAAGPCTSRKSNLSFPTPARRCITLPNC